MGMGTGESQLSDTELVLKNICRKREGRGGGRKEERATKQGPRTKPESGG